MSDKTKENNSGGSPLTNVKTVDHDKLIGKTKQKVSLVDEKKGYKFPTSFESENPKTEHP